MIQASPSRARWAVGATFLLHGMLIGGWVPHIPLAKERLEAGPALFGLALLSFAGGAVFAMPLAGALINRFGSATLTTITGFLFCFAFFGPIFAPTLMTFVIAGFVMGMVIGSMDVAMNSHGIAVEKALRLPTMSMFHGGFSIGGMVGAFLGAALLKYHGEVVQACVIAVICLMMQFIAMQNYLPAAVDKGLSGSHFAWPTKATIGLGLLCFLALMIEGSILDWAAIMMREKFLIDASFAALAFGFYQGGMSVARLTGDWIRQKAGAVRMVTISALMAATGTALALVVPWTPTPTQMPSSTPTETPTEPPAPTEAPLPTDTATPLPTRTPAPTATPGNPVITFYASPDTIRLPDCTTLYWWVDRATEVFLILPSGQIGVEGSGQHQVCPQATTTYRLKVNGANGRQEVVEAQVIVLPPPTSTPVPPPRIKPTRQPLPTATATPIITVTATLTPTLTPTPTWTPLPTVTPAIDPLLAGLPVRWGTIALPIPAGMDGH